MPLDTSWGAYASSGARQHYTGARQVGEEKSYQDWVREQRRREQEAAANAGSGPMAPGPSTAPTNPNPAVGPVNTGNSGPAIDQQAFYDAMLARRGRSLASQSEGMRQSGMMSLGGRGLDFSPAAVNSLFSNINRQEAQGFQQAQGDVYGQQFAEQQKVAEWERQKQLQMLQFEQQAALLKLQKKLAQGDDSGGWFKDLLGLAGDIIPMFI